MYCEQQLTNLCCMKWSFGETKSLPTPKKCSASAIKTYGPAYTVRAIGHRALGMPMMCGGVRWFQHRVVASMTVLDQKLGSPVLQPL